MEDLLLLEVVVLPIEFSRLDVAEELLCRREVEVISTKESYRNLQELELLHDELAPVIWSIVNEKSSFPSPILVQLIELEDQLQQVPVESTTVVGTHVDCDEELIEVADSSNDVGTFDLLAPVEEELGPCRTPRLPAVVGLTDGALINIDDPPSSEEVIDVMDCCNLPLQSLEVPVGINNDMSATLIAELEFFFHESCKLWPRYFLMSLSPDCLLDLLCSQRLLLVMEQGLND